MAKRNKTEKTDGELLIEAVRARDLAEVDRLIAAGADASESPEEETPLGVAAELGDEKIVAALLKGGADPDFGGLSVPLAQAAWNGHAKVVRALLDAGASVAAAEEEGMTALMAAARAGRIEIVKMLLDAGADPKQTDGDGQSALLYGEAHAEVVKLLSPRSPAKHVAGLNAKGKKGKKSKPPSGPALVKAAKAGDAKLVKSLLEEGMHPDSVADDREPALCAAADDGHVAVVELLIAAGADVNAPDQCRRTPLHGAAKWGHLAIGKLLLSAGAAIDPRDDWGMTPLLHGVGNKPERRAMAKWLAASGADIHAKDENDQNFLSLADRYVPPHGLGEDEDQRAMRDLLREIGLVSTAGVELTQAAADGNVAEVERLLKGGADVNAIDEQERTALWMAVSRQRRDVTALLLKAKADPNKPAGSDNQTDTQWGGIIKPCPQCSKPFTSIVKPWTCPACGHTFEAHKVFGGVNPIDAPLIFSWTNGWTPLTAAARLNDVTTATLLLDAGAKVDRGREDATPLMCAVTYGHVEITELLIGRGAKVNAVCKETGSRATSNLTAIDIAGEAGNLELMELLWAAGAKTQEKEAARLVAAARAGDVQRVKSLLKSGASIESADPFSGDTALLAAAHDGRAEIVKLLLDAGASMTPPKKAFPLVMKACVGLSDGLRLDGVGQSDVPRYVETVRTLIAAGAPARVAFFGMTPLSLAEEAQVQPMVELLNAALEKEKPTAKAKPKRK